MGLPLLLIILIFRTLATLKKIKVLIRRGVVTKRKRKKKEKTYNNCNF